MTNDGHARSRLTPKGERTRARITLADTGAARAGVGHIVKASSRASADSARS